MEIQGVWLGFKYPSILSNIHVFVIFYRAFLTTNPNRLFNPCPKNSVKAKLGPAYFCDLG
jgi:hypothetical protein